MKKLFLGLLTIPLLPILALIVSLYMIGAVVEDIITKRKKV